MSKPSTHKHEEALFALAIEKPADKRAAFLDAVCEGQADLRQRLEALLAAHEHPDDALETIALPVAPKSTLEIIFANDPLQDLTGQTFGHYQILRLLGKGGMGVVYEAHDMEGNRRLALKLLIDPLASPDVRERFLREGRWAASLNHPHCVYVFATEEINGVPAISMELMTGGTLEELVKARGPLPAPEAVDAILQVIDGLEAAGSIGILHRDIKPANCFVANDGSVKVGDFGLSISTRPREDTRLTATGSFLGTPKYASPEQLIGDALDTRSDIYSVGATLFFLLVGRAPFDSGNLVHLISHVLNRPAALPKKGHAELPRGLCLAVLRCLEKEPLGRFNTYRELREELLPFSSAATTPATLGLRLQAGFIDAVILFPVVSLLQTTFSIVKFNGPQAIIFCCCSIYFAALEGSRGASLGKRICGLHVIDPNRGFPTVLRAWSRVAVILLVTQAAAMLLLLSSHFSSPRLADFLRLLAGTYSFCFILGLLFSTARKRNGFAAAHDLLTRTGSVLKLAPSARSSQEMVEAKLVLPDTTPKIGPYFVLEVPAQPDAANMILAYDGRLRRKVWVRKLPVGAPPVPTVLRDIVRPGRLTWLNGIRSAEESWDAYEALSGKPWSAFVGQPQPWSKVRFWLMDVAEELSASMKDNSLPGGQEFNRIWITAASRAKLLDFAVSGVGAAPAFGAGIPGRGEKTAANPPPLGFLCQVACAALTGRPAVTEGTRSLEIAVPLPLHARKFLKEAEAGLSPDLFIDRLKPLLEKTGAVSRARRIGIVATGFFLPLLIFMGFLVFNQERRSDPECVSLGFSLDKLEDVWQYGFSGGLDGHGSAYPAELLESASLHDQATFNFGPANSTNVVSCAGQIIRLPPGSFSTLRMLGTAVNGEHAAQHFVLNYNDGTRSDVTQSFSDWRAPQNYPGESPVLALDYLNAGEGKKHSGKAYLYGYSVNFDSRKQVVSITLPENNDLEILAMTLLPTGAPVNLTPVFNRDDGIVTDGFAFSEEHFVREALEIYIVGNFRSAISNEANWNWATKIMIQSYERDLAKRLVAKHAVLSEAELKDATDIVDSLFPELSALKATPPDGMAPGGDVSGPNYLSVFNDDSTLSNQTSALGVFILAFGTLTGIPALLAALLFRGGVIFWCFGLAVVKSDGSEASRLRVFWRSVIAWSMFWFLFLGTILLVRLSAAFPQNPPDELLWPKLVVFGLWVLATMLVILSSIMPSRSWQDRFAGTYLVPK